MDDVYLAKYTLLHHGVRMAYRDEAASLLARNAELTGECERLNARIAELEEILASDNSKVVLQRMLEALREENAKLRSHLERLDPGRTMEERDAHVRSEEMGALLWRQPTLKDVLDAIAVLRAETKEGFAKRPGRQ